MDYCHSTSSTSSSSSSLISISCSINSHDHLTPSTTNKEQPKQNLVTSSTLRKKQQRSRWLCKYKGVVPQQNGRWGAQLYHDNKRIWIGTFERQENAARAYDMVVIRFRGPNNATTNFPVSHYGRTHLEFLGFHSHAQVVDMLRTHTYAHELNRFMATRKRRVMAHANPNPNPNLIREMLFEKVMTPSDIGKLRRLVIPKHHAEKHLPKIAATSEGGIMLNFEDGRRGKIWRFKYCHWSSSNNYVLTKGWGEFVKNKGLRAGDTVMIYASLGGLVRKFYIDTRCNHINSSGSHVDDELLRSKTKVLRLFGVDIIST